MENWGLVLTVVGILISVLGILVTFFAWLFPEQRHTVLSWLGSFFGSEALAATPPDPPVADSESMSTQPTAADFISLGEHLWYLSKPLGESPEKISRSLDALRRLLKKCGFVATLSAARCTASTTVGRLQSQMVTISSSLYGEATSRQAAFIKLGELLWYLTRPQTASTGELENGIRSFLAQLEHCQLQTRQAARPLERFRYVYFVRANMVAGSSLDELSNIMEPIRHRLEHETENMVLDE